MARERRYDEDEVREIFTRATSEEEPSVPALTEGEGLTLAELQDVGREVGVAPSRVAEAAAALDARGTIVPRSRWLGAPVSVGRIVELPRAPTSREWDILVGELRHTFAAQGRVGAHGEIREWRNSNLYATVEPTGSGHRLRMGTRKGGARELGTLGIVGIVMGVFMLVTGPLGGAAIGLSVRGLMAALLAAAGGGVLIRNVFRLGRWADERESQMDYIGQRARALLEAAPSEGDAQG